MGVYSKEGGGHFYQVFPKEDFFLFLKSGSMELKIKVEIPG